MLTSRSPLCALAALASPPRALLTVTLGSLFFAASAGALDCPFPCNDNNVCTSDICNTTTGQCIFTPSLDCNDGDGCTTDVCDSVAGCQHTRMTCDDRNVCTDDICNPTIGLCVFTPKPPCPVPDCQLCDPVRGCVLRDPLPAGCPSCIPVPETRAAGTCANNVDDDCDGLVDAADPDCNAAPDCTAAVADPSELWPANRRLADIAIAGVSDADNDAVTISVTGITQDEPLSGHHGAGHTCPDGVVGGATATVRAERIGRRDGRVYHVAFTADDGKGGSCSGLVTVCVPHNLRRGRACVDEGPLFDSSGSCD